MGAFFNVVFVQPLFNGLIAVHHYLPGHDLGLAIIVLTVVIRTILIWPSLAQIRASKAMQELQPKLKELQKKYASDRQELAKQTMALYRESRVNPLASCLPTLIQIPFLFALYRVFISSLHVDSATGLLVADRLAELYGPLQHIYATTTINTLALGFLDLAKNHNLVLAILVGASQFVQAKMLMPKVSPPNAPGAKDENMAAAMSRQSTYIFPFVTAWLGYTLVSGLGLYIFTTNVFSIIQQALVLRKRGPSAPAIMPPKSP